MRCYFLNNNADEMKTLITIAAQQIEVDLSQPIDISIPLSPSGPLAWNAPPFKSEPVVAGEFIGSVAAGAPVNFKNIFINPHGNGTHTECVGHIAEEPYTIHQSLKQFHFLASLITISPIEQENGDRMITLEQVQNLLPEPHEAVVLRTLPNGRDKLTINWSDTNPPYIHHDALTYWVGKGVRHLLLDLPSVDREWDDGKMLAHKAFWQFPNDPRTDCTITEMIYVPDEVADGTYFLNLQITSMENDASPSKPVLYGVSNK